MDAKLYTFADLGQIQEWCKERGIWPLQASDLPGSGFVVQGIAAGFLYLTDSSFAILDGYISNPKASREERDQALDLITARLIAQAKYLGFTRLKCDSAIEAIKGRARKFGFKETGTYSSFVMEI